MSKTLSVFVCTLALVSGFGLPTQAQDPSGDEALADYIATTWSEKDGLSSTLIRAIERDADGYLWLGTASGLVRFDGVRFVPWETLSQTHVPARPVFSLFFSHDRTLWIGFGDAGGIGRIRDGQLRIYGEPDGIGTGYIASLIEDRTGTIWAGGRSGLYRFRHGRWEKLGPRHGLPEGQALGVYEDRKKRLWVATSSAVFRRTDDRDTFQQVEAADLSNNLRADFSQDSTGTMWITDFQNGFRRLDDRTLPNPLFRHGGWGVQLHHDRRGNLWVATRGQGLWRVRGDNPSQGPRIEITVRNGLLSDAVLSLLEDADGNIWVGTYAGLHRFSPRRVMALTNLGLARAVEVTKDGSVWVGTTAGLIRFSKTGRQEYGERQGLPGSIVLALHTDATGTLWVAANHGLARFVNGRFSPVPLLRRDNPLRRIFWMTSAQGAMWIGDYEEGLFRLTGGVAAPPDAIPDAYRKAIFSAHTDKDGTIWIGFAGGQIAAISPEGKFQSYDLNIGDVNSIYEDRMRTHWFGGSDGLSRLTQGRFITVNRRNGFPGNASSINEDEDGFLWVGLSSAIIRLERSEFDNVAADPSQQIHFRLFDTFDGVAGGGPVQLGSPNTVRASDGKIWFVTSRGMTVVDPKDLGTPHLLPTVRIEAITADARQFDPIQQLLLPARIAQLRIDFTALTWSDPRRARFRYRLDGFDDGWVDGGSARQATYTNLPPRPYRFRVVASNDDGIWNDPGAAWTFAIKPTFYQTGWFYAACAITVGLLAGASWRLRVHQVRHQFALVLAERIRMSRAIHDTLLQGLVGTALQIDDLSHNLDSSSQRAKDRLTRIRRQVEDSIREARSSIWDLRSPRLKTRDLGAALREAGERAVEGTSVHFQFTASGVPLRCSPQSEEQLLLIAQEALNNAIRHGLARRVDIDLHYDGRQLCLRVSDDGCGFDLDVAGRASGHYGLLNMRERAEQVQGRLKIATGPGRGTQVETVVWAAENA